MTSPTPIRDSIAHAFAFVRENVRFIALVALIGAGAEALIGVATLSVPSLGLITSIVSTFVQACAYAALVAGALFGGGAARMRWTTDGPRVWAAMAIIGFFLFIVCFVASIVAGMVMVAGPLGPYLADLESVGSDQVRVLAVMTRFAEENPLPLLLAAIFFGVIWMYLTSRLYLAAPASVDQQRILSFETWKWTQGAVLRIIGARLMLLLPANIFVGAIGHLVGRLVGINTLDPATASAAAQANPAAYLAFVFVAGFLSLALYSSLEAGLSSALYRTLKPAEGPRPSL